MQKPFFRLFLVCLLAGILLSSKAQIVPPCPVFTIVATQNNACEWTFTLTSNPAVSPVLPLPIEWSFGDGTSALFSSNVPVVHQFPGSGNYQVCATTCGTNCGTCVNSTTMNTVCTTVAVTNCSFCVCDLSDFDLNTTSVNQCTANFTTTNFQIAGPCTLTGTVSWDFGDGTTGFFANNTAVSHQFPGNGTYQVCATAQVLAGLQCADFLQKCTTVTINNCCNCTLPDFQIIEENTLPGCNSLFSLIAPDPSNCTADPNVTWDFGDGTTGVFPSNSFVGHQFPASGIYQVCATRTASTTNGACVDDLTKCITVNVTNCDTCTCTIPDFQVSQMRTLPGCDAGFRILGTAPTSCDFTSEVTWDFGDGTTSTLTNTNFANHQYMANGTYQVCATRIAFSTDSVCSDTLTKCTTVNITDCDTCSCDLSDFDLALDTVDACQADFAVSNFQIAGGCTLTGNLQWDFGDGNAASLPPGAAVSHTYAGDGAYQVCVTAQVVSLDGLCSDQMTQCLTVVIDECDTCDCEFIDFNLNSLYWGGYSINILTSNYNISGDCQAGPVADFYWGDGTASTVSFSGTTLIETHTYPVPNPYPQPPITYNVCVTLHAENSDGSCEDRKVKCIPVTIREDVFSPNPGGSLRLLTEEEEGSVNHTSFLLFPNPARHQLTVLYQTEESVSLQWKITNMLGQVVQQATVANRAAGVVLEIEQLAPGSYFITVQADDGSTQTQIFVKE
ncbi:MAG: PKD domain-containing protein [Salibacteraceae bacterium]